MDHITDVKPGERFVDESEEKFMRVQDTRSNAPNVPPGMVLCVKLTGSGCGQLVLRLGQDEVTIL